MTTEGYRWWDWQVISYGRWYRLYLRWGWVLAFIPLGIAALLVLVLK